LWKLVVSNMNRVVVIFALFGFVAFTAGCRCGNSSFQQQVSDSQNLVRANVYNCWIGHTGTIGGAITGRNNVTYCSFRVEEVYKGTALHTGVTYVLSMGQYCMGSLHPNTEYLLDPYQEHGVWRIQMCGLNIPFSDLNKWQQYVIQDMDVTSPDPCTTSMMRDCHNCTYRQVQCFRYPCPPIAECHDAPTECQSRSETECTIENGCNSIYANSCLTNQNEYVGCKSSDIMCSQIVTCGTSPDGTTYTFANACVPEQFTTHPSHGNCCSEVEKLPNS